MSKMIPQTQPRLSEAEVMKRVKAAGLDTGKYPFFIVGIRGYYLNTMGKRGVNDRGIYDDAIFLVSPNHFSSYNANTDPSYRRNGSGFGRGKGMATLKPGVWLSYCYSYHNWRYPAICQRKAPVTVLRDKVGGSYEDTGMFGINIHKGSWTKTSSEGCQTIPPSQWKSFMASAVDQAQRFYGPDWKSAIIPYVLLEAG
jgi:lysozyme